MAMQGALPLLFVSHNFCLTNKTKIHKNLLLEGILNTQNTERDQLHSSRCRLIGIYDSKCHGLRKLYYSKEGHEHEVTDAQTMCEKVIEGYPKP